MSIVFVVFMLLYVMCFIGVYDDVHKYKQAYILTSPLV